VDAVPYRTVQSQISCSVPIKLPADGRLHFIEVDGSVELLFQMGQIWPVRGHAESSSNFEVRSWLVNSIVTGRGAEAALGFSRGSRF